MKRLLLLLTIVACDDKKPAEATPTPTPAPGRTFEPMLTEDMVAPAAKRLVLGVATVAEVAAAFGVGEIAKDKSLGGTARVEFNDKPAVRMKLPAKDGLVEGEAWFQPIANGQLRMTRLALLAKASGNCEWIGKIVASLPNTTRRPGSNRVFGKEGNGYGLTAGTTDGTAPIGIECHPSERDGVAVESLSYTIEDSGGVSMMVQENP
jgi:hypothetical protein